MADKSIPFINDNLGTFQVGGNVLPSTNISYSLGTPSNQWSSSYIVNMYGTASQAISASFSPGGSSATYTSSLFGTASWAINVVSSSTYNMSSSIFGTASWANNAISASYAPGSSPATYTSSLFGTASWANNAISASYAPGSSPATYTSSLFGTASWAGTASYSLNALGTPSASYAETSSFLNPATPVYGATSSFNPLTGISQGSCILWIIPSTGNYMDSFAQYPATVHGQQIRYMEDFSGLGRDVYNPPGTMPGVSKFMYLTNVGQNKNKVGMWIDYANGCALQSAAISYPTYPLWLFVVAKMPSVSVATGTVFDGIGASNRMFCQVGTTIQMYSGASFIQAITGSLTGSIQNKWFLQAFKNTAGGNNSSVYTNGTQSAFGSCGGQSIGGYSIGGDYAGNGGGVSVAEMMLYSNITDADAASISTYLMGKHELFY